MWNALYAVMAAPLETKPVVIREVWGNNVSYEFSLIRSIIDNYCFIAVDTEFPGVVVFQIDGKTYSQYSTAENLYMFLKANVDVLKLIQVGLTFMDSNGNLPDLGTGYRYIWQFNFCDFDVLSDQKSAASIDLLRAQGIDFEKNRAFGVDSAIFAELMMTSGMVCSKSVTWIAFHGAYDFGYLIKILTQRELPEILADFMALLEVYFGNQVYDVKCLMKYCDGLYGGLNQVARSLWIRREVGKSHQAGSDSLLTCRVFHRIWHLYFRRGGMEKFAGLLHRKHVKVGQNGEVLVAVMFRMILGDDWLNKIPTGLVVMTTTKESFPCSKWVSTIFTAVSGCVVAGCSEPPGHDCPCLPLTCCQRVKVENQGRGGIFDITI